MAHLCKPGFRYISTQAYVPEIWRTKFWPPVWQDPFWTHCVKLEKEQHKENQHTSQYEFFKSCVHSFLEDPKVKGCLILVSAGNWFDVFFLGVAPTSHKSRVEFEPSTHATKKRWPESARCDPTEKWLAFVRVTKWYVLGVSGSALDSGMGWPVNQKMTPNMPYNQTF